MKKRKKKMKIIIQSHKKFRMCLMDTKMSSMAKMSLIMTEDLDLCFLYVNVLKHRFKYKFNIIRVISTFEYLAKYLTDKF